MQFRPFLLIVASLALHAAAAWAQDRTASATDFRAGAVASGAAEPATRATAVTPGSNIGLAMLPVGRDYRVGANDLLEIEVLDLDNLKRTVRVNAAGAISLPLIGAVQIAGLTSQEVEARLADRYREKYLQNPQVSVFIKEFTTERITVEGAVAKPGIYPLAGQMTLLRALALAGGFGPIADSSKVMLFRMSEDKKRQANVFDVDKIRSGESDDPVIKGDDLIVVQKDNTRRILKDSLLRDVLDSINPFSMLARP